VSATNQHPAATRGGLRRQFSDESGLADACLTDDGNHPTPLVHSLSERRTQARRLLVAPNKGRVPG
jgi:hypothetical protein